MRLAPARPSYLCDSFRTLYREGRWSEPLPRRGRRRVLPYVTATPGWAPRASGLGHDSGDPRALTWRTAAPRSPGTQPASSPPGDQTPFGEPCGGLGLSPNHTTCPAHAAERPGALSTDAEKRVTVWPRDPRPGRRELTLGRVLMSAEWRKRPRFWSDLGGPGEGRRPARLRLAPTGPLRCCSCDPAGSFAVRALVLGPDHP